ncbi:MAG: DUF6514 family protein [Oscillospiraceae bacterium]|jgi:hypothetical protein|nr:DUF6514 family protein [Oscillospiraceae bacterium]
MTVTNQQTATGYNLRITKTRCFDEDGTGCDFYGIVLESGGQTVYSANDITANEAELIALLAEIEKEDVSILHIPELVEDLLLA